jgi:hypothetical protein
MVGEIMKTRRHHNNKGSRQIRRGKTVDQVKAMARRLGLKYKPKADANDKRAEREIVKFCPVCGCKTWTDVNGICEWADMHRPKDKPRLDIGANDD